MHNIAGEYYKAVDRAVACGRDCVQVPAATFQSERWAQDRLCLSAARKDGNKTSAGRAVGARRVGRPGRLGGKLAAATPRRGALTLLLHAARFMGGCAAGVDPRLAVF